MTSTPADALGAAQDLAPTIAGRAGEIEAGRRLPMDLVAALVDAGCFRILLPESHGGAGRDLASALRVFETLARADASTGWTVMIGAMAWCDLAALPGPTFDALFAGRHDVIVAGAFNPTGSVEPVGPDAYRVSGRWGFASGCQHATWLFGNCVEGVVDGVPRLRAAVFAPDEVTIEDTWSVAGLRGTGSHHFRAEGVVVAGDRTFAPLRDEPCLDAPVVRVPTPALFALGIAGVAVGVAAGAMDEITALATDKVPMLAGAPLAASALFQRDLAAADTELRALRALLYETAEEAWATAGDGAWTLEQRARVRAAAAWTSARAAAIVDGAYRSGGGTSLYAECPLQRRLRDIHALTQHFLVRRDTLATAGAVFAGQDVQLMVF